MKPKLIRRTEAAAMLGIGQSTLSRMIKDGRIEQPIRLGRRVVGWREETLLALLGEKRDGAGQ
ncbi:helix-turn-helix transcriptional regulator [Gulbenkiania mobilis]|uniref:helix-turn-helix transcriptional regulator n=1 Tax=Gulbenkiania mobilis TaxID=397457 RepID=UPI0006BC0067|nr:AlpA family phage regulatory protein [Gulbenkiania mobilis]